MPKKILAAEYPPLDENEKILNLAERLKAKITADNVGGIMRRDAHPKMQGVVKAEFIVGSDLPAELRVGLFAQPIGTSRPVSEQRIYKAIDRILG